MINIYFSVENNPSQWIIINSKGELGESIGLDLGQ